MDLRDNGLLTAPALMTTKGDVLAASAANTPARLGVGSNDQVLTADSAQSSGVKWGAGGTAIQTAPGPVKVAASDHCVFVSMHKDTNGTPDRCVVVTVLTTSSVALVEYKRLGGQWIHNDDCAYDTSVALNFTAQSQAQITAFAIDSPVASGDRVVFIAGNDTAGTPDTFEMDSIVLTPGSSALTATAVVIAGANELPASNGIATACIVLSTTRAMTWFGDDAYRADITEAGGTYTFTYADATVVAVDTSIGVSSTNARAYSGITIGAQVLLLKALGGDDPTSGAAWEMDVAASLTEEFNPFAAGIMNTDQAQKAVAPAALTAISGVFAIAAPVGGDGADGQFAGYLVSTFPLDDI